MASATPNRLIHESSPYLLQHAYNPVDWFPWGEEALERSRKENKPIFLSIGYSSCHWCHVMERESFEDPRVAEYLNEHFIPIKVDREERPDLDALYMDAVQLMTGQGGWPLNIWLTPALIPIYGGTYFPPAPAWQRPDFMSVLQRLVHIFTDEPEQLSGHIRQMQQAMELDLYRHINASPLNPDALDQAFSDIRSLYDAVHGGFSQAPKFPQAMSIEFLLQYARRTGNQAAESMGIHSLSAMVCGGLYDQIGGGFHRYSTDKYWLVPHFEKMLYDNALLLTALTSAWQVSKQVLFKETVEETVGFLKREMLDPDGGFYSAIDADSEGREGRYYVWTYDELQTLLNKTELDELKHWYSFDEEGNWEGSIILSRENPSRMVPPDRSSLRKKDEDWSRLKDKLLNTRRKREHPQTDDKVLTAWNGLLIKSLVQAARAFGRRDWLETAITTADFILNNLYRDGILHRIYRDGNVRQPGFLDDYGSFAESLTWIFEATARERYLETARELTEKMLHLFYDEDNRAFYFSGDYRDVPVRQLRDIFDNVTPSGTSSALTALTRLSDLTGEHRYYELARGILEKLQDTAVENPAAFGYFLQALIHWHEPGREVVLVGPGEERKPWREIWSSLYAPHTIFIEGEGFSESDLPLLAGKEMVNGRTAAYLCEHFMCKKPVTEINEYIREIEESHRKVS